MKKIIYITISILLLFNTSFAEEKINISIDNTVIQNATAPNVKHLLYGTFYPGVYDLFRINFPDSIKIIMSGSKIITPDFSSNRELFLERKPKLLDFLIEKMGEKNIKKYLDNGDLHIIGDLNKVKVRKDYNLSKYYLGENTEKFKGRYLDISKKYKVYNNKTKNIKLTINPFNKKVFSGFREYAEPPYPLFSIFDNSLLPQDLMIDSNRTRFYPKIKYTLQPYIISTAYDKEIKTKKSYVFMPSYEFDIKVPEGESVITLSYKTYFSDLNRGIIVEMY